MVTVRCPNCQWVRLAGTRARAEELFAEHLRTHVVSVPAPDRDHGPERSEEDTIGEGSTDE